MTTDFTPDWTKRSDLPDGFNDLPEDERAALMMGRVRLLHIHGQGSQHDAATIVGNRNALLVLRDAIDAALAAGAAETSVMAADGEGYGVLVDLDDHPWDHPSWETRPMPYTDAVAGGALDLLHWTHLLEAALRKANAQLVKRGVKPVPLP